jgi:cellulose synthase/poly-beta-1,6-N-acetylglucosamine synthase-like glycosyltransferase
MPLIVGDDRVVTDINALSIRSFSSVIWVIYYIFFATLIFGILRLIIVILFAFLERYHLTPQRKYKNKSITVSVIVPAYNE